MPVGLGVLITSHESRIEGGRAEAARYMLGRQPCSGVVYANIGSPCRQGIFYQGVARALPHLSDLSAEAVQAWANG